METRLITYGLLESLPKSPSDEYDLEDQSELNTNSRKGKILCRECRFKVSASSFSINVNGSHEHSFFNPHGYVFEIRCFSAAPGCMPASPPSSEFSWFAGHTWQIAACSLCNAHLGWKFQSGASYFYGLIKNNILDENK